MERQAFLHIGLPKTGTTYVQQTLRANREALAGQGVHLLGAEPAAQRNAAWDLVGRRIQGAEQAHVAGAWQALADEAEGSSSQRVLLSEEFLVHARPKHVRKVVSTLGSREMHVVVTVRDLGRVIASMWQQNTAKGRTISWTEYVGAVRDPESGPPTAGVAFWLRYDVERVLSVWSADDAPERTHVVIVPPAGSNPVALFERFAAATGIDCSRLELIDEPALSSLAAVDAEVLRRLNESLRGELTEHQYLTLMRQVVRPALRRRPSRPTVTVPPEHRDWVRERSERLVEQLRQSQYAIVGNLEGLLPAFDDGEAQSPDELSEAAVAEAAVALLSSTLRRRALSAPKRRPGDSSAAPAADARSTLLSRARALDFRARVWALNLADRSTWAAKAANAYLRRYGRRDSARARGTKGTGT